MTNWPIKFPFENMGLYIADPILADLRICLKSECSSVLDSRSGFLCFATHPGCPTSSGIHSLCCSAGNPCSATRQLSFLCGM